MDCEKLISIQIPNQVDSIETAAFANCSKLSYVHMPNHLKYIGGSAFEWCPSLAVLELPYSLIKIDEYAFQQLGSLKSIFSQIRTPFPISETMFACFPLDYESDDCDYCYEKTILYVPYGCADIYRATPVWNKFKNIREMDPTGVDQQTISEGSVVEKTRYTVDGFKAGSHTRGLNIVVMSDGSRRKVMVK